MKIYLAGKIGADDWRHSVVSGLKDAIYEFSDSLHDIKDGVIRLWRVLPGSILGTHDYTGPYFIACDHGCGHGENSHGLAAGKGDFSCNYTPTQAQVRGLCYEAIANSDVLFAWITDKTVYGTLVEIGIAWQLGVKVYISGPELFDDLWFAYQCADTPPFVAESPAQALSLILQNRKPNYYEYIYSEEWKLKAKEAKKRAGFRCQLCNGEKELNAHHRTYDRLGSELPEDITVLCRDCHAKFHDKLPKEPA